MSEAEFDALKRQERVLTFPAFDEEIAHAVGAALRARASAAKAPVVIDIRTQNRRYYFSALAGSTPDNDDWARRKANVVLRCHESSYLVGKRLAAKDRPQWPDQALPYEDYATHGGAFPVRVASAGVIASIAVSGLPSRDDHDMIVRTLADYLGVTDCPRTP